MLDAKFGGEAGFILNIAQRSARSTFPVRVIRGCKVEFPFSEPAYTDSTSARYGVRVIFG
jgi:hypothetical protein